ncbi:MAG: hypothetical protein DWQ07_05155 [Chloroflexi bacterium]|nr:MAG: hypothetical protein DWQ07_05155 [Chloroflexota bacterium]MBL1194821.1 hypothetical protein [Chloroflexota bacterium]NOH12112.1 hypothetical protein [Chloroflexota bacterium]
MSEELHNEELQAEEEQPQHLRESLPLLLESTYTIAKLIVIVAGALTAGLSIFAGADLLHTVLRTGTTLLGIGVMMWLIFWFVTKASWQAVKAELKAAADKLENETTESSEA